MNKKAEIEKRIKKLPQKIRKVLESGALDESLRALAQKYKIHLDKWEKLEEEVYLVLLSVKSPKVLPGVLTSLGLDPETAQNLLQDLVEYIFKPMRKMLQEAIDEAAELNINPNVQADDLKVDPRAPQFHGVKPDPRLGQDLDKPFNLGELPEITDPYREKIEW